MNNFFLLRTCNGTLHLVHAMWKATETPCLPEHELPFERFLNNKNKSKNKAKSKQTNITNK